MSLPLALLLVVAATASPSQPYCADSIAPIPAPPSGVATLEHVSLFIRHGDRTQAAPGVCWPNDNVTLNCTLAQWQQVSSAADLPSSPSPLSFRFQYEADKEVLPGSCGLGQLTEKGADQQHQNGRAIADAYIKQSGLSVKPADVYARADNSHRTIMSGQALLDALLNGTLSGHVAMPFYTRDSDTETITPNGVLCPAVTTAYNAVASSPEFSKFEADAAPMFKELTSQIGQTYDSVSTVGTLFDCYFTHACHGLPVPSALANNATLVNSLVGLVESFANLLNGFNNSAYAKAGAAPLLRTLLSELQDVVAGKPGPKVTLMSGHDTGPIQPLLYALGVADGKWPPYASRISVELWKMTADSTWAVRMEYNGKVLQPKGCPSVLCPFDTFVDVLTAIIPVCPDTPPNQVLPSVSNPLRRILGF